MRKAQSTLEYAYLIGIVAVAIIATAVYMKRGFQGNLRGLSDQIGAGAYSRGNTTLNNSEEKRIHTTIVSTSTTTTTYGNNQADTPEIRAKREEIKSLSEELTSLYSQRLAAVKAGDWNLVKSLDETIKTTQASLKQARKDLKKLIEKYKKRGGIVDQTKTDTLNKESGKETLTKQTNESLGSLSGDTWH